MKKSLFLLTVFLSCFCLFPSIFLLVSEAAASEMEPAETLIYEDMCSRIYSRQFENGDFILSQFDNSALTSRVSGNIYSPDKTLNVKNFGSSGELIKEEFIDTKSIVKGGLKQLPLRPLYINYSKLGDVHCLKTGGSEFDIGFFFATTATDVQTIYNPVMGNYAISVLIGSLANILTIPLTVGASVLEQVLIAFGSAVISNGFVSVISEEPVIARQTTYSIRLNRYYDNAIMNTTAGFYSFNHKGSNTYENEGLVPIKNYATGYQVKEMMFPSGGATYLGWR